MFVRREDSCGWMGMMNVEDGYKDGGGRWGSGWMDEWVDACGWFDMWMDACEWMWMWMGGFGLVDG